MVDLNRRGLFRGRVRPVAAEQRMPWQVAEAAFTSQCSRCEACISACPEQIVSKGDGGFPRIDFRQGECTFCQACVDACPEPVFRPVSESPWQQQAVVSEACLNPQGVMCRSCQDSCEPEAILFLPRRSVTAAPQIDSDLCSGCGACVSVCPSQAIRIAAEQENHDERG